jgi:hypothetical protein
MLKRRLSIAQWASLVILVAGVAIVQIVRVVNVLGAF